MRTMMEPLGAAICKFRGHKTKRRENPRNVYDADGQFFVYASGRFNVCQRCSLAKPVRQRKAKVKADTNG